MVQKDHKVSTYLFFLYRASIQFSAEYGGDGGFAQQQQRQQQPNLDKPSLTQPSTQLPQHSLSI